MMHYEWKKAAELTWMVVLAVLGALVAYLNGVDFSQLSDTRVLYPAIALIAGRAAIGALQAGIPKVLPAITPQQAVTLEQVADLMDQKLTERLGSPSGLVLASPSSHLPPESLSPPLG